MSIFLACAALAVASVARAAEDPRVAGKAAYDAGRFAEAADAFETALAAGGEDAALRFNLGNTRFRAGDIGRAVLEYRRAWRLAPRDPDIAANLGLALDRGGAPRPAPSWVLWPLERISSAESRVLAVAGWWAALLLLAASWAGRRGPAGAFRRAAAVCAVACLAGLAGLRHWRTLETERVAIAPGVSALYAPLEGASTHFTVPCGSIVSALEDQGPWVRIRLAGREGWIPAPAAEPVVTPRSNPEP
ncbi:MAG: tetratricopeptide repeat protein [Verrucomicrobia bacterium]|nr:tetratricopeptide repeat protein [Verrucomicrobiota bacterium]